MSHETNDPPIKTRPADGCEIVRLAIELRRAAHEMGHHGAESKEWRDALSTWQRCEKAFNAAVDTRL